MWEAIRSNRRRSWWLIAVMGVLLVCLGAAIGMVVVYPDGALLGAGVALLVWLVLWLIAVGQGESMG
jgi:vacuolar-type H+-ATPase subunit I/STV1